MNVGAIGAEIARRLVPVVEHVYVRPPAQPVFPCAIVNFPNVEQFHVTNAHSLTRMTFEVELMAGRGDSDDAVARCEAWVSTDTPESVMRAIEARDAPEPPPWQRIKVVSSNGLRTTGDGVAVTFIIEADA